jgi:hypothetical protein
MAPAAKPEKNAGHPMNALTVSAKMPSAIGIAFGILRARRSVTIAIAHAASTPTYGT